MSMLLLYSLIGGAFSLLGGLVLLWKRSLAERAFAPLLSFAAGAFLSAAFLDILPEAVEAVEEPHPIFISLVVGFVSFFFLERLLMTQILPKGDHAKRHSDHTESLPVLLILGDSLHNFLDGIVIAIAYAADPSIGLVTTFAVASHEIPQEIGDFSVLLLRGWSKKSIIVVNVLQSLLTIPGVLFGTYLGNALEPQLPYLLAATSGIFMYLAASDIIPEIHHRASHHHFSRVVLPFLLSIILVGYLTSLAHGN